MLEELKEDINQYNEKIETYKQLCPEDIDLAYDLAVKCLILADRWNEIMLNSVKYCTLMDIKPSRTLFEKWAYHKYRILMTAHEYSRVVWRQGKEEYKNNFNKEM